MLLVVGAGFPRTGTTSTKAALERLGFGPCYHMFDVMMRPGHAERWVRIAGQPQRTREDWDRVFAGYRSCQDWPAGYYWRELAAAYPDAKVVLTVRDPHRWYPSMRTMLTLRPAALSGDPQPGAGGSPELDRMRQVRPVLQEIGAAVFGPKWRFGEELPPEDEAVAAFERHVAEVRAGVTPGRLLVFDAADG